MYVSPLTQADYFNRYLADPMRTAPTAHGAPEMRVRAPPPPEPPSEPVGYRDLDAGGAQEPLELQY